LIIIFFYCKNGEPMVIFCLIGAPPPAEFIPPKSKTTFLYSRLRKKKRKERRGVRRAQKSTCFECKKLPKPF
jgi:hypothetical protein